MIDANETTLDDKGDQEIKVVGAIEKIPMKVEDYNSNEGWKRKRKSWHEVP